MYLSGTGRLLISPEPHIYVSRLLIGIHYNTLCPLFPLSVVTNKDRLSDIEVSGLGVFLVALLLGILGSVPRAIWNVHPQPPGMCAPQMGLQNPCESFPMYWKATSKVVGVQHLVFFWTRWQEWQDLAWSSVWESLPGHQM